MEFIIFIFAALLPVGVLLVNIYNKNTRLEPNNGIFDIKNNICVIDF